MLCVGAAFSIQSALCALLLFHIGTGQRRSLQSDVIIETPMASMSKVTLPDNSIVWLNAGSRLCYPKDFGRHRRDVIVNGEALFEVTRNEKLPFLVKSNHFKVQVLGTRFQVQDFMEDSTASVSLMNGRVSLNCETASLKDYVMTPENMVVLDVRSGRVFNKRIICENVESWTQGRLYFDEEALPSICTKLERSYGVRISIRNEKLMMGRYFGDFNRSTESVKDILKALSSSGKFHYKISGSNITLY